MKGLVKTLLFLVIIGCVCVCGFSLYCLHQLNLLAESAQTDSQQLTLKELTENGAGDNHHVSLSQFSFGEPIIEKKDGEWEGVWLTLLPQSGEPEAAVLWAPSIKTQDQLDEYLQRETVDALVSSGLPKSSVFRIGISKTLKKAFTKEEPKETSKKEGAAKSPTKEGAAKSPEKAELKDLVFLSEPVFVLFNGELIEVQTLLAETTTQYLYGGLGGAILLGIVCFLVFGLLDRPVKKPRPTIPSQAAYNRLASEPELSLHPFSWQLVQQRLWKQGGAFFGGMICVVILLAIGSHASKDGHTGVAAFMYLGSLMFGGASLCLLFMCVRALTQGISGIQVSQSGLSWLRGGKTEYALWEDIAEVYRVENRLFRNGQLEDTCSRLTVKLFDGRDFGFSADTFVDFPTLAENIQALHGGWILDLKNQELSQYGEATFGDKVTMRRDGLVLNGSFYHWTDLDYFQVENGALVFRLNRYVFYAKINIALGTIPNYLALLSLLQDKGLLLSRRKVGRDYNPILPSC